MRAEIAIVAISKHNEPMIQRPVKYVVAHIALFKNMNAQAAPLGFGHRRGMDRTGVPIKDNIGHALRFDQINKGLGPIV